MFEALRRAVEDKSGRGSDARLYGEHVLDACIRCGEEKNAQGLGDSTKLRNGQSSGPGARVAKHTPQACLSP